MVNVSITDNTDKCIREKNADVRRALEAIGIHLEGEAKEELENSPRRVDTGRLKGSIVYATEMTHSRTGQPPATPPDYRVHSIPEPETVYVGTNVEYAAYVHEGTRRMAPNRFLKNAFERNTEQIIKYLKEKLST